MRIYKHIFYCILVSKSRQRKMKVVDLTKHGNPLLEHARLMNNPNVDKANALTRVEPRPQDIPLSEVAPIEVQDDYDNSAMIRESRLDYISPLHQSNPRPNWNNRRGRGRGRGRGGHRGGGWEGSNTDGATPPGQRGTNQTHNQHQQQGSGWNHQNSMAKDAPSWNSQREQQPAPYGQPPSVPQQPSVDQQFYPRQPPGADNQHHAPPLHSTNMNPRNPYFESFQDVSRHTRDNSYTNNNYNSNKNAAPLPSHQPPISPNHRLPPPPPQHYNNNNNQQQHGNSFQGNAPPSHQTPDNQHVLPVRNWDGGYHNQNQYHRPPPPTANYNNNNFHHGSPNTANQHPPYNNPSRPQIPNCQGLPPPPPSPLGPGSNHMRPPTHPRPYYDEHYNQFYGNNNQQPQQQQGSNNHHRPPLPGPPSNNQYPPSQNFNNQNQYHPQPPFQQQGGVRNTRPPYSRNNQSHY